MIRTSKLLWRWAPTATTSEFSLVPLSTVLPHWIGFQKPDSIFKFPKLCYSSFNVQWLAR